MPPASENDGPPTNSSPAGSRAPAPARYAPVTARAVLLGLFGAAAVSGFQVVSKAQPQTVALPIGSTTTLLTGVVFYLFLLSVLNTALRARRSRFALRPSELAVIYGLTTVGASIGAQDEAQYLWPMYAWPFRSSQDDAMGPFRRYIPEWMIPQDRELIAKYYAGHENFWQPEIFIAWMRPFAEWMVWLIVLGLTMWAWNVILRRRWVEHDRLSFPCVQLPLEMCRAGGFGGMAGGRLFWAGFAISALVESLNQIGNRFPNVPTINLDLQATPILETMPSPWKALAPMYMTWGTLHIGICYLIPQDILFSSWFFYVMRKALEVWGYAMGWRELGWDARGFPYTRAQSAGAWAALFILLVWAERKQLARIFRAAFSFSPEPLDDEGEPGSYRWAGRILVFGMLFLVWWSVRSGMTWGLAILYYAFFWALTVTMTRIYAQVGPPILELYFLDPQKALTTALGTLGQPHSSLTQFSLMYWINRDHRGQPMAHQLSAMHIGMSNGVNPRALGVWIPVAFAVGAAACLLTYLHWAYHIGEDQWMSGGWRESGSGTAVGRLREWVYLSKGVQWTEVWFMGIGAAMTVLLSKINFTFIGTPFHPIGYALAVCFAVEYNWPVFLGVWGLKALLLRYGGLGLYLRYLPAALGLTLGGLVVPVIWGFFAYLGEWYK